MTLKNYSSQISAMTSISLIEAKLISCGARQILKEYNLKGRVTSIAFIIEVEGNKMPVKLPARIEQCEQVLKANIKRPTAQTYQRIKEQAERTAWKILYDWVEVQMSMIELAQVELMEVFLPYVYNPVESKTYFEIIKERGFQKLLPESV